MGGTVPPTQFPAPGAIAQGQPATGVVQQAQPQPGSALKTFDPSTVPAAAPTPAPTPAPTTPADTYRKPVYTKDQFYGPQYQGW